MESRQLFSQRAPGDARVRLRRSRSLPVLIASILLPGSGHFFLRQPGLAIALLLFALLAPATAIVARALLDPPWNQVGWLIGRIAVLSAVFAVWDAPLRTLERAARRPERGLAPRLAAYSNAVGYGLAQLRMGEKGLGALAIVAGGGAHVALVLFAPGALRWAGELLPLALAWWGYRAAEDHAAPRMISTNFDDLDHPGPARRIEQKVEPQKPLPVPTWWHSSTAAVAMVWLIAASFGWTTQGLWIGATRVDTERVVQMEPYYRNPDYGIELEMHAPGWSFRAAPEHAFVLAHHAAETAQLQLLLRPRLPWWDDPVAAADAELEGLAREGLALVVSEADTATLAGRPAYRVRGRGIRDGAARQVELRMLPLGHRRYVLRMEWDPDRTEFAHAELRGLLAGLQIEGAGGEPTFEPTPAPPAR